MPTACPLTVLTLIDSDSSAAVVSAVHLTAVRAAILKCLVHAEDPDSQVPS